MKQNLVLRLLAVGCLVCHSAAVASDRNLIQTLYHADFVADADDDVPGFSLDGELGVLAATGNTHATSLKAGITSEQETYNWSNSYFAELLYKESEVSQDDKVSREKTAQRFFGYAQFDYKLNYPGRRLFMYADYENDSFNGYDYRASLAAGYSQRLWRNEESEFRYSIGPGYSFIAPEADTVTSANDGMMLRASAEYRYRWPSGARFRQFVSTETGANNTRSRSETSVAANLFGSFALKVSVILNHETDPADEVASLNTETSIALVYQFF